MDRKRQITAELANYIQGVFERYCLQVPQAPEPNTRETWVLNMIHAAYRDWRADRLSDEVFAFIVDRIFTS